MNNLSRVLLMVISFSGLNVAWGQDAIQGTWKTTCFSTASSEFPHWQRWGQYGYEFLDSGVYRAWNKTYYDPACTSEETHSIETGTYKTGGNFGEGEELDLCSGRYCSYTIYSAKNGRLHLGEFRSSSPDNRPQGLDEGVHYYRSL
ncbi:MAG: hypothetical protein JST16_11295 [Bdellovibrionales bacterium]|nr:hypothetical protein [Bdellovibrionales bacterium]